MEDNKNFRKKKNIKKIEERIIMFSLFKISNKKLYVYSLKLSFSSKTFLSNIIDIKPGTKPILIVSKIAITKKPKK